MNFGSLPCSHDLAQATKPLPISLPTVTLLNDTYGSVSTAPAPELRRSYWTMATPCDLAYSIALTPVAGSSGSIRMTLAPFEMSAFTSVMNVVSDFWAFCGVMMSDAGRPAASAAALMSGWSNSTYRVELVVSGMIAAILPLPARAMGFRAFMPLKLLVKELTEMPPAAWPVACASALMAVRPATPTLAASATETIPTLLLRSKFTEYLLGSSLLWERAGP